MNELLHQIRALYGAIERNPGERSSTALELAKAIHELDNELTIGTVLPRPWQRSAVHTLER